MRPTWYVHSTHSRTGHCITCLTPQGSHLSAARHRVALSLYQSHDRDLLSMLEAEPAPRRGHQCLHWSSPHKLMLPRSDTQRTASIRSTTDLRMHNKKMSVCELASRSVCKLSPLHDHQATYQASMCVWCSACRSQPTDTQGRGLYIKSFETRSQLNRTEQ